MGTISTWELREQVREDGGRASDEAIAGLVRWGILREPEDGRWSDNDVKRAREARALAQDIRSLPRRALRLYGRGYPMPPDKLRAAMKAVAPTVTAPAKKVRRVGDALRLRYEVTGPDRSVRHTRRRVWRLPQVQWADTLNRFSDHDFETIAQYTRSEAIALDRNPAVQAAATLSDASLEEVWLVLTLMQLTVGDAASERGKDE